MKMEKINENTIRVLVEDEDLSKRGITVLDLLGNRTQIEDFFYSILREVDTEHEFENNEAVTFQVLPNRDGLELFISRGKPEDIQNPKEINISDLSEEDDLGSFIKDRLSELEDADGELQNTVKGTGYQKAAQTRTFEFGDFEDFIQLAKIFRPTSTQSNLFKVQDKYFLELIFDKDNTTKETIENDIAVALEYAQVVPSTGSFLEERGKKIMSDDALSEARKYFK
ncbi:adaptor protein MecA [Dellaglioa algida]|uniref:Adapter protein MecA n=3 Tax=Dellaglioa algida TaxID=105612 RepID=A0A0R1HLT2_9LACO|nr:adaptor protein MecA [Dellaglioa algida]KRK45363.1 adaptor protein [Dellaglioa algida DSM 15638]MDK1717244.1 adaptor protein MecA [Dellaglioa algida]MDK1720507.1 adaptor protein MecA [Dellaglioa algida]MDK1722186.1 adaptor protein MecA [Dellaglioa algida]MDK1723810.1 adaptor protein MecA [Dellaglioa algida]